MPLAASGEISVGSKIEARYRGRDKYFPGRVRRVNANGTFDIDYDDGEKEINVDRFLIRTTESRTPLMQLEAGSRVVLRPGMRVEARFKGKHRYYPGVIRRDNNDSTYNVDYDDVSRFKSNNSVLPTTTSNREKRKCSWLQISFGL